jgi:hypothetical protein
MGLASAGHATRDHGVLSCMDRTVRLGLPLSGRLLQLHLSDCSLRL